MSEIYSLNGQELQRYQPNRYPFLMIDRVTSVSPGIYAEGFKNLTNNEWFFPKHFEGNPNMPGALQLVRNIVHKHAGFAPFPHLLHTVATNHQRFPDWWTTFVHRIGALIAWDIL